MITDQDFSQVLSFIEEKTGIALPETHYRAVKRFIEGKLKENGCQIPRYIDILKFKQEEYEEFINVVTINETYFFREAKQFKILDKYIFPQLIGEKSIPLLIWSAACSTGEEAISLTALGEKHFLGKPENYSLYATDISPYVLSIFKKGIYSKNSFRRDGESYHYLMDYIGKREDPYWLLNNRLKDKIAIRQMNLCNIDAPGFPKKFHIIFLRNTLIYMPDETRKKIISNMVDRLADNGYLFLSMSETALVSHPALEITEQENVFFFKKRSFQTPSIRREIIKPVVTLQKSSYSRIDEEGKYPVSTKEVCRIANAIMEGRDFGAAGRNVTEVAREIYSLVGLLNTNMASKAALKLSELEKKVIPNELIVYLKGYMFMVQENTSGAIDSFRKAVLLNNTFWLPRFYLGKLLHMQKHKDARREIVICNNYIKKYLEEKCDDYQFMLEGFNAKYFQGICEKWLDGFFLEE